MSFVRMFQESLSGSYKNACPDNSGVVVRVLQECCPDVARITIRRIDKVYRIICNRTVGCPENKLSTSGSHLRNAGSPFPERWLSISGLMVQSSPV